jgi:hypothetical protein
MAWNAFSNVFRAFSGTFNWATDTMGRCPAADVSFAGTASSIQEWLCPGMVFVGQSSD